MANIGENAHSGPQPSLNKKTNIEQKTESEKKEMLKKANNMINKTAPDADTDYNDNGNEIHTDPDSDKC